MRLHVLAARIPEDTLAPPADPLQHSSRWARLWGGNNLAVEASRFFKRVGLDVLKATGGHMDLPTLAAIGFMAAGAAEMEKKAICV